MSQIKYLILFLAVQASFCYLGFDVSIFQGSIGQDQFACLLNNGFEFGVIQAWDGGDQMNSDFAQNYRNAKAAGINSLDLYVFACNDCDGNSPDEVVSTVKANLPSDFDGMFWIDVEPCSDCWLSDNSNLNFVNSLAETAQAAGFSVGVYSSEGSWGAVTGGYGAGTALLSSLPLWYAHYDGSANFGDTWFYEFGGWKAPSIKQYDDTGSICGTSFDLDYSATLIHNPSNPNSGPFPTYSNGGSGEGSYEPSGENSGNQSGEQTGEQTGGSVENSHEYSNEHSGLSENTGEHTMEASNDMEVVN